MIAVCKTGAATDASPSGSSRKRAVVIVGYHYLSTPVYEALKTRLPDFDLFYFFPKDTIGSDTNYKHFDRSVLKATDSNYVELPYDPPWFRGIMTWHLRNNREKLWLWFRWVVAFPRFKRELIAIVRRLAPDVIIATSDLFFTPRYLAHMFPDLPMAVIQPCYLDLWERPERFSLLKNVVNLVQPMVFARQQYFGFEIPDAALLVWEPSAQDIYTFRGRPTTRITNPTHLDLRDKACRYRRDEYAAILRTFGLPQDKPVVSFFSAYYADVKGHGKEYQAELERALVSLIKKLRPHFSIVVKGHPNEDMNYWRRVFAEVDDGRITLVHNCDRFRLMAISDVLVSTNSYAAVEATLCGCVTVNFVPGLHRIGEEFCRPFNRNVVVSCTTEDAVVAALVGVADPRQRFAADIARTQETILGEHSGSRAIETVLRELAGAPGRSEALLEATCA